MSTYGSPQRRYAERKRKDPEYCARVLLRQREQYRRLVADPVTRKKLYERKKRSFEKCKEKKRLQKLERQQDVKNGAMNDIGDGMLLDIKEKSAVQCPSGKSEGNMVPVTSDYNTSTEGEMIHDSSTQKEMEDFTHLMSDLMKPLMKRMMEDIMSDINQCLKTRVMQYFNPNSDY